MGAGQGMEGKWDGNFLDVIAYRNPLQDPENHFFRQGWVYHYRVDQDHRFEQIEFVILPIMTLYM